ncbi:transglutaminase-like domain-containing protein [Methanobacterium sp. MBAC-LM]|uniref:transglutaminase-like domain-containing protein n=1 Tax=Methanobacterium sp. MBAC-LM TaxID=3412034 RepID=UPI003C783F73
MAIGGGIITRKLLFAVLLVASMSLIGIAGVSAANVGTATTQTGNHHTVQKDINLHDKYINTLKKPIKTQKKVVKKYKTVKKTVNTTNNITQFVNKNKTVASSSKNSVKAKNNTVAKSVPKYAYGEKPKYAYGHKKKVRYAHKWYRYHGKWYRYHGKVHKYKKTHRAHRYHRSSANSSSIKALAYSLTRGTSSQYQKGARIFNWVRNNLRYSFYYNTRLGAAGALKYRKGNCADTSHLVVALARSAGLQAKYGHGKVRFSSGRIYGHVWAIIKANGRWYTADASSNRNSFGGMRGKVVRFQGYHNSLSF